MEGRKEERKYSQKRDCSYISLLRPRDLSKSKTFVSKLTSEKAQRKSIL